MAIKADDVPRPRSRAAEWTTHRERGSRTLLRLMTFVSLHLGRPTGRFFLYFIAAYFFAFAPTARRHSRAYLRRALGREPTPLDRFRHILTFATTIHDRVYLMKNRLERFEITVEGADIVRDALEAGKGAFLMGSHVGSFDIIRCVGERQPGLRVAMAMYEENARKVNEMLAAIDPAAKLDVIPLGRMDAMLKISEYLDRGTFVGVLADRTLGAESALEVEFLGDPARFPLGAMRAAALMRRPVIFMIGLYRGGNRYHVVFEHLADFSEPEERDAAVREAVKRFARLLERHVRDDPFNWFNFFDFWRGADD
jgi:predicted LPLAT superfamily acyltransferase